MTGLLEGKTALIFGIANKHSIAWGIAQAFNAHGAALGFSYAIPQLERRVRPLAADGNAMHSMRDHALLPSGSVPSTFSFMPSPSRRERRWMAVSSTRHEPHSPRRWTSALTAWWRWPGGLRR